MGRTKKLISKISKSRRANKNKNIRISKKKVGGSNKTPGRFSKPREGRRLPQTNLFGRSAGKKSGVEGLLEKKERTAKERAGNALRELLKVVIEYKTSPDAGRLWINFLRSLRYKHIPGEIMLDYKILEHFRKLIYLLNPEYKEETIRFLQGVAQAGEYIDFKDAGYTKDGKLFATWLLEMLSEPQIQFKPFSIYSISPV